MFCMSITNCTKLSIYIYIFIIPCLSYIKINYYLNTKLYQRFVPCSCHNSVMANPYAISKTERILIELFKHILRQLHSIYKNTLSIGPIAY